MNCNWCRAFVLAMTCLSFVAGPVGAKTRTTSGTTSDGGTARFMVYRIPTMGRFVVVQIYVDNDMVGSIGYGSTYDGVLKPGHHVLSVLATPRAKWGGRPPTNVDMQSGQTYRFTAVGDNNGNLILVPRD